MQSNNGEKYFSCACIKARSVEVSFLTAVYKRYIPKSKTFNLTIYIRRCGEMKKEMQFSVHCSKYSCGTGACPHQFHVDTKNEILCHK